MSNLLPCPFCEAALVWSDTYREYHHPIAKCILSGHKFKKGMIGQWNRRALPAVQPDAHVNETPKIEHDAAPASIEYAGGRAWDAMLYGMGVTLGGQHVPIDKVFAVAPPDREEVAEALWWADQYQGQIRLSFAKAEGYIRNHWLKLADVAIEKIKGGKK